ncbi:hypothetical protein DEU56DRAFT_919978 [Suillus clintonianus]|uniref:uncharacterized protein n=1 Tax=Suillus clintonianus TaxID=1904413 RepID=UPI001B87764C|nr:uncharacterized protein DEU56DRAFT_919978 [Suillus clintonianus]KAG2111744.1 hypothetical protein DEU56DRAFT_919978 [Suillus clintonianus]
MASNSSRNGVLRVHHHPEYYLEDGNVTFHVENLFRVHKHFFECESQFFVKEFEKAPQEGTSDSTAFRIDRVSTADFAKLLWVWYDPSYRRESKPKEHWLTILELSTIWQFPEMKKLAKYHIHKSLLLPAYMLLCKRASRMSAEEGEQLKMPTVLGIHEARERAARSAAERGCRSPTSADADDEELEKILNDVFSLNATNRQGAQPQGKPNPVPIIKKPEANGAANGSRSSASGSDDDKQKEADKNKGTEKGKQR